MIFGEKKQRKLKIVIGIVCLLIVSYVIGLQVNKYRFGYFIKGPQMKYEHERPISIIALNDNEILILGHSRPDVSEILSTHYNFGEQAILEDEFYKKYHNIPSEIYNFKTNEFMNFPLKKDVFYEPEGIVLDKNNVLLTRVCKTDKQNKDAIIDCYNNMLIAIYNFKTNNYSFKKNLIKRKDMYIDLIEEDKILIIGGNHISALWGDFIPDDILKQDKSRKLNANILEYDLKNNIVKSIDIIPANIKINKNNIIKLKNKVYVFSYEQSVYKLDLATLDLKKMITLKSKKEITSLCKITEDKIAFINSNKIFIYNIKNNEIEIEMLLPIQRKNQKITSISNNILLITGGLQMCFPSNYCNAKETEFLNIKNKKIYRGVNIERHADISANNSSQIIFLETTAFLKPKNTVIFKINSFMKGE